MPKVWRNAVEADAEYILISPPNEAVELRGANHPAPRYYFHLAKFPVTNQLYRMFVQARNHRAPLFGHEQEFADDHLPVVGVDWEDAERYCEWLNLAFAVARQNDLIFRLPTEEEWEWAASGLGRIYPWGNAEPTALHANFGEHSSRLTPVGDHPAGATPDGVREMAGNVWEWTATTIKAKLEKRIVRGGAAFNEANVLRCTTRDSHNKECSRFLGFRVACVPVI